MAIFIVNLPHELKPIAGTHQAVTISTTAVLASALIAAMTGAALNAACTHVRLQNLTVAIREKGDGTSPTATTGYYYAAAGAPRIVSAAEFAKLRWIRDTGAGSDATLVIEQLSL